MKLKIILAIILCSLLYMKVYQYIRHKSRLNEIYVYDRLHSHVFNKQATSVLKLLEDSIFNVTQENIQRSKYYKDIWCKYENDSTISFFNRWNFQFDSTNNLVNINSRSFISNVFKEINIEEAEELLKQGVVKSIFQAHDHTVTMEDKSGNIYLLLENKIDDIIHLGNRYKDKNKKISIGLE